MIWSHEHKRNVTLAEFAMLIMAEIQTLRKELQMDFTALDAVIAKLQADTSTEIANAVAAIQAAQNNPADVTHLAAAVTSLQNLDAIIAGVNFSGTATNTGTGTSS